MGPLALLKANHAARVAIVLAKRQLSLGALVSPNMGLGARLALVSLGSVVSGVVWIGFLIFV